MTLQMALTDDRPAGRPRPIRSSDEVEQSPSPFDRQPPQDLTAEQSVLGGMLLSKDAIADVVEVLRPEDFYRPAHQTVYNCILDLYGRGEPADAVTVSAELQRRGDLIRLGGAPYLHTLIATVPTAANAAYYAEIVAEKAILRRLVEAGTRIVQLGYHGAEGAEVNDIVDRAQATIYEVTERSTSEDFVPLEELLQPTMDEIDALASRGGATLGVPTGFTDLDTATNGLHPGQMIVIAARPGLGKSTLGLDFARSCSVKHRLASVVFSLEMSKSEIVMRLLSAEARIRLADMRAGRMNDDDWTRMARRMSEISEAPLFIDDSPNLTLMEIRAKARRLKQRHNLKLVILDYLQLMTSGRKVESRQQEVSEFSRQIKLLAKELEVPVVAISQLNRGPEQRTDKRPMLADLRESGCLTADTRLLRADTGAETSLGDLLNSGEHGIRLWSLDEHMRIVPREMTRVFPSGVKKVFRLRLTSGREVRATANHPFLTHDGWRHLADLNPGDQLATPRRIPAPLEPVPTDTDRIIMLAHLLGSGAFAHEQPPRYTSRHEENLTAVAAAAERAFGITAVRDDHTATQWTTLWLPTPHHPTHEQPNPITTWLDELGLPGVHNHEKFIPAPVFALPDDQIALFLHHLWATNSPVSPDDQAETGHIHYTSTSHRLVDDLARLLLRFGIPTHIEHVHTNGRHDNWHLHLTETEHQRAFTQFTSTAAREPQLHGSTTKKHPPNPSRPTPTAAVLKNTNQETPATNDVFWDEIAEITSLGEQPVFDATVPGTHNFIANGIILHNSIEQDADMVILLHRPDAFERDDPRAGEADLILAKHRNGPTNTITVAHQLHYSRFADLTHG